ncbi:IspD/TarI family cytidylyltransferase [Clostridium chromiireducens]|uniref:Putative ribitol-5-phosphate cytidylyltransferase n=1 Tax=Clostridium chromiireducens TaxID=225345 RepID=A0A1V4IX83_9CLOT|nr:IspD/TarI family cytidylyltransferase [Clostridium chromiireducens]OPJ64519.1 putative ribitol-5-phosphate cytidylyltransferase [Clostridium chromiireducens]
MATALIFAGGTGSRMNSKAKPKQFLELHGKSILIYTIEYFELNEEVDNIVVVCLADWIDTLKEQLKRNYITKVKSIVEGGKSGQESIYNGLKEIYRNSSNPDKEIVLIHDGVRPLISSQLITKSIQSVREFGSAITVVPVKESIISTDDSDKIQKIHKRNNLKMARAPQSFYLKDIWYVHNEAIKDNKSNMVDSASLMMEYGYKLHTIDGVEENIKITTSFDYYIFRAIYEARENSQILGL